MYFYKPPHDRWRLCIWDLDMPMGTAGVYPATNSIFFIGGVSAPEWRFLKHPPFCRAYLRALRQAMNGPARQIGPLLDAKAAVFAANGVKADSPQGIKDYLAARTDSINRELAQFQAPFSLGNPGHQESLEPQFELRGTASFEMADLRINGTRWPVVWTTVTNWSVTLPLTGLTNHLTVAGYDTAGNAIPEVEGSVTVVYTGHGLPGPLPLFINEWLAANTRTCADPADGDYADWFEIFNPNAVAVDLFGYRLTDDPANTVKFVIPAGWSIPPGGHLLVWADEESSLNPTRTNLHVNFKLSREGERLALYRPDGALVDAIQFGPQTNDVSQGRWPDGAGGAFSFFPVPTPGAANALAYRSPRFTSIVRRQRDELVLTWTAIPGRTYRMQYQERLADLVWQQGETVVAVGETAAFVCPVSGAISRFYRVQLDPP